MDGHDKELNKWIDTYLAQIIKVSSIYSIDSRDIGVLFIKKLSHTNCKKTIKVIEKALATKYNVLSM